MKIVRYDRIGSVQIRLLSRPTNTAVGVDNFHIWAAGLPGSPEPPVVRFLGTDEFMAHEHYDHALLAAEAIVEGTQ